MRYLAIAVSMFCLAGLAQAHDAQVEPYRYDMTLDIARVVSIETPQLATCEPVTAIMTYEDSAGAEHKVSYRTLTDTCKNQN